MFRLNKPKTGTATSARRREELRRTLPRPSFDFLGLVQKPQFLHSALFLVLFMVLASTAVIWSRDQIKVRDGQVMTSTRLYRLGYTVIDEEQTLEKREEARRSSPRLYRLNESHLNRLANALGELPRAVAGKMLLDEISKDLQQEFALTESDLRALQTVVVDGEPSADWTRWVSRLVRDQLLRNPLLKSQEYQVYITTLKKALVLTDGKQQQPFGEPIELRTDPGQPPDPRLEEVIARAGFPMQLVPVVLKRLLNDGQPTFLYWEEETTKLAESAALAEQPVKITHQAGEVLYRKGDRLSPEQYSEVLTEAKHYRASLGHELERWQQRAGIIGLLAIITLFIGSFAATAYPLITQSPLRIGAMCILMATLLGAAVLITAYAPIFLLPSAVGATLFVAVIMLVAYDQRLALLLGGIQCMLVTLALEQSIGFFVLLLAGCATAVAQLREVRHRNSLIRAATGTAAVLAFGTLMLGLLETPMVAGAWPQIIVMALSAGLTSYGVGFLVLGILPSIERIFDITTGMTLAELRDPKRPLLRQLQQRAPGTYTHSIQVANIAEAAAEAVGADSLLVYVGALYHDVGKINKPEYFVENQAGGYNRHDKLSPAMSLLVIIGHVKNGIELARECGVPKQIQHFIESHHGTTLVEYFYHAAKAKAERTDQGLSVSEVEYRYPGPKPQTKEAAILMLSDAVESATRAIDEPTPSRIDSLVRKLSARRLEDGQFDECNLTFRELNLIEDAIINRLLTIHHSRISYPAASDEGGDQLQAPQTEQAKPVSA
ncbi:MAG: HDIG domain-containing protein [Phycisphaerales bacterium]|nr:HDIG domain-containing protein [Phycisphaerales bacterium]MCI0674756.1 HDIG domain-containing protein [Phycisphaerales bacterium]